MPIAADDVAVFLQSILAELRAPRPAAVRSVRITTLVETAERRFDQRPLFGAKLGKPPAAGTAVSIDADRLFWRCASELRRVLSANLSDEGKCIAIETLVSEAHEELHPAREVEPPESSEA